MKIYTSVDLDESLRVALRSAARPDDVYFADPEVPATDDRAAFAESDVAFGWCPPEWLEHAPRLRWLQLDSVGCDDFASLDWERLGRRLTVTNLRGLMSSAVAETALAGVLAFYRGIGDLIALKERRDWRGAGMRGELRSLRGARALLVGYGSIGKALARLLGAFGCAYRTFGRSPRETDFQTLRDLDAHLPTADLVFAALPQTPQTTCLFDRRRLELLNPRSILVSVGRGSVLDEAALVDLLTQGRIAGAVLDVTQREPLPVDDPLWSAPNVILTQHTAGGSSGEMAEKTEFFLENLRRFRVGEPLENVVDWCKGY